MRARRRLPVIAGMALSAVAIAAPAAHADDFGRFGRERDLLSPRQDCSRTIVQTASRGGVVGDIIDFVVRQGGDVGDVLIGNRERNENVRLPDRVMGDKIDVDVRDSFNCSNIFKDSFNVDEDQRFFRNDHREHREHREHGEFRRHGEFREFGRGRERGEFGEFGRGRERGEFGEFGRGRERGERREHRERTAATAPTAATAATAPTAPTARAGRYGKYGRR